jgi:hypothetical protein
LVNQCLCGAPEPALKLPGETGVDQVLSGVNDLVLVVRFDPALGDAGGLVIGRLGHVGLLM